ncbi:hypothetical protein ABZP36_033577 [Zizania latifolia]
MANPRGARHLPVRLRRLLRSPISRCAGLLAALAALLLVLSLRQVARVDLPSLREPPRQARSLIPSPPLPPLRLLCCGGVSSSLLLQCWLFSASVSLESGLPWEEFVPFLVICGVCPVRREHLTCVVWWCIS